MKKLLIGVAAGFVLAGGVATAATRYVITSKSQIAPSVLRAIRGKQGARGPRGASGSSGATGVVGPAGPAGPTGPTGPSGPPGAAGPVGPAGQLGSVTEVSSSSLTLTPGETTVDAGGYGWEAQCPSGDVVVGTGFDADGVGQVGFVLAYGTFAGGFITNLSSITIQVSVQAVCAPGSSTNLETADARFRTAHAKTSVSERSRYAANLRQAEANA